MRGGGQDSSFHLAWGRTWVRLPVESLPTSHSPVAEMLQSHFIKKPKLMGLDLGSHCPGPSPVSGNEGTTLGLPKAVQAGLGEVRTGRGPEPQKQIASLSATGPGVTAP